MASFFLPVTLKKRAVSVNGALVDEWTADWDHEQLIALQQQQVRLRDWCGTIAAVVVLRTALQFF